jgi:hypothetical protein
MQAVHVQEQDAEDDMWAKEKDVTESCRILHNENLYDCTPYNIL